MENRVVIKSIARKPKPVFHRASLILVRELKMISKEEHKDKEANTGEGEMSNIGITEKEVQDWNFELRTNNISMAEYNIDVRKTKLEEFEKYEAERREDRDKVTEERERANEAKETMNSYRELINSLRESANDNREKRNKCREKANDMRESIINEKESGKHSEIEIETLKEDA